MNQKPGGLKVNGLLIDFSAARFTRQFSGVMAELLFRQYSLKRAYSRSFSFGTGQAGPAETFGKLIIFLSPYLRTQPRVDCFRPELLAQFMELFLNIDMILDDQVHNIPEVFILPLGTTIR